MKIYTKTGDKGETGLFGGERVRKNSPRIVAYGAVDELNAFLGVSRQMNAHPDVDSVLKKIQNDLFDLGAVLATPNQQRLKGKASGFIRPEDAAYLEQWIDRMETELPPLKNFVLPGGSALGASFHVARTVCRRAEREIVTLNDQEAVEGDLLIYMNRLSDFLFVLARWVNFKGGISDAVWEKK